jgi:RNA polymerase subunit RPABC4/transcription elongation factor Spt4
LPYRSVLAANDNPFQSVSDFFTSSTWDFIVRMAFVFLAAVWLACAYWVFKDARRRMDDKLLIAVAVLTGLVFGPFGLIVYAIVRPPEYLDDVRERELEVRMMEQRLSDEQRCSFCKTPVRDDYLVCPTCGRRLRTVCRSCGRPVEPQWRLCPYCEAEVHGAPVTAGHTYR